MQDDMQDKSSAASNPRALRLGYMDRAHLLPLLYPAKMGWVGPQSPWELEVVNAAPSELLDGLLNGRLDAALLSPAAVTQHGARLMVVGGWGLASEQVSHAGILLAPQRLDLMDGGELAISPQAVDSMADYLLRMLLKPYYDINLSLRTPAHPEYNLAGARLLYGDDASLAVANKPESWVAEDMGLAWWVLTGLPTVWEMLAAPRDLQTRKPGAADALNDLMTRSLRAAHEQQSSVIDEASQRLGMKKDKVKELFSRQQYALREREQKGLARFLDMASRAGILTA